MTPKDDFQARRKLNEMKKEVGREARERRQAVNASLSAPSQPNATVKALRMLKLTAFMIVLVIVAFFAGRFSYMPAIAQHLPKLPGIGIASASPPQKISREKTTMPDDETFLHDYIRILQAGDIERLTPYADPAYPTREEQSQRNLALRRAKSLSKLDSYKIDTTEKTARYNVIFRDANDTAWTAKIDLTYDNGQWQASHIWF